MTSEKQRITDNARRALPPASHDHLVEPAVAVVSRVERRAAVVGVVAVPEAVEAAAWLCERRVLVFERAVQRGPVPSQPSLCQCGGQQGGQDEKDEDAADHDEALERADGGDGWTGCDADGGGGGFIRQPDRGQRREIAPPARLGRVLTTSEPQVAPGCGMVVSDGTRPC